MSTRPTHYQILGVVPTASADEIARAFARESSIFRPHAFGALTEICIAYEALRDPIKRRAYDVSIGLDRNPAPPSLSIGVRGVASAETMVRAAPVERRAAPAASQPEPQPASAKPALPLGPGIDLNSRPEPSLERGDPFPLPLSESFGTEARPVDWKRTGIALGGIVLGACIMGGLAGWWSASGIGEASPPAKAAPLPIPEEQRPATLAARDIITPARAKPIAPEARLDRPRPALAATGRVERKPVMPEPAAVQAPPEPDEPELNPSEPVAIENPAPPAATASMPLSNRVIARTIERIGYSCGSVAATVPAEGEAAGVYKVTCSSGQSYQAKPVNGRYRFRRLGR